MAADSPVKTGVPPAPPYSPAKVIEGPARQTWDFLDRDGSTPKDAIAKDPRKHPIDPSLGKI